MAGDKITLNLTEEAAAALREIATLMGLPLPDAARRVLGDVLFLRQNMAKGWRIMLERRGEYRDIIWRDE